MAVLATRRYIDDIAKRNGYRTGEYCGHFYIDKGEYRIYVLNAREFSNMGYDRSIDKDHLFDWCIKKKGAEKDSWEEIFRTSVKYLTRDLYKYIPNDLKLLEKHILADIEMTKNKYNKGLAKIAAHFGLDISNPAIRQGLLEAYKLGQRESNTSLSNSVRNKIM